MIGGRGKPQEPSALRKGRLNSSPVHRGTVSSRAKCQCAAIVCCVESACASEGSSEVGKQRRLPENREGRKELLLVGVSVEQPG